VSADRSLALGKMRQNQNIQRACPSRNCFFYDRHRTELACPEDSWKYPAAGEKLYCSCSQPCFTYVGLVGFLASFWAVLNHFFATHFCYQDLNKDDGEQCEVLPASERGFRDNAKQCPRPLLSAQGDRSSGTVRTKLLGYFSKKRPDRITF
jgi:hypothetical protein